MYLSAKTREQMYWRLRDEIDKGLGDHAHSETHSMY